MQAKKQKAKKQSKSASSQISQKLTIFAAKNASKDLQSSVVKMGQNGSKSSQSKGQKCWVKMDLHKLILYIFIWLFAAWNNLKSKQIH